MLRVLHCVSVLMNTQFGSLVSEIAAGLTPNAYAKTGSIALGVFLSGYARSKVGLLPP